VSGDFVYNYFRDYSPEIGRYIQSDPIGLDGGINTYRYVEANPLAMIDPQGLASSQMSAIPIAPQFGGRSSGGGKGSIAGPLIGAGIALGVGYAIYQFCKEDDTSKKCSKASAWQLRVAGIVDEHDFKEDFVKGSVSKYDICACEDGSIVIRARGLCGKSGPTVGTGNSWK